MTFDFPIRQTLRTAWGTYKTHWQFFCFMSLVTILLNIASDTTDRLIGLPYILGTLCFVFFAVILSFVWVRVSLAAVRGDTALMRVSRIRDMLPKGVQVLQLVGIGVLTGIIVLGGFVALIIPGVYLLVRLVFVNLSFVDKNLSVGGAIRYSWHLVRGEQFWTVLLVLLVSVVLIVLGVLAFGIGLIVTYPLVMLLIAYLYKALDDFHIAHASSVKIIATETVT